MSISVKQFASESEYEEWLAHSAHAIEVLDIRRAGSSNAGPGISPNSKVRGAVVIKYRTTDRSLERRASKTVVALRLLLVALVALVVFTYAMRNMNPAGQRVKLLKLDNR